MALPLTADGRSRRAVAISEALPIMTGILVTRFKMGQIDVEDLEEMAADTTWAERCSAAKKVMQAIRDSADL